MKLNTKLAKRYAKGLYDFAASNNQEELIYNQMISLLNLIKSSKDLRNFLNSPILDSKKKNSIANLIFDGYNQIIKTFISLVLKHKREIYLDQIAKAYIQYYQINNNYTEVIITTATELDQNVLESIYKNSKFIPENAKIILEQKIDKSLIGGYILRIGDQQIDTSIKSKLLMIKQDFNINHYVAKF